MISSEIAAVYDARWVVELILKELKSRYKLDYITTKIPYAIRDLIWISIQTLLIRRKAYSVVRKLNPDAKIVWVIVKDLPFTKRSDHMDIMESHQLVGLCHNEPDALEYLFLNEYPAACCGWDGQETDLRKGAYSMLND